MNYKFAYILICLFYFYSCKSSYKVTQVEYDLVSVDSTKQGNEQINEIIRPYSETLDKTMNEVVCNSAQVLTKSKPESSLGNLLADATFFEASNYFQNKPDLAIVNYGGIRIPSLPKGEISLGKIYELMPFDNYINLVYVKGNILKEVCDLIASNGGWPVSGIYFKIKNNKAENILIQEEKLDVNKVYKIAISDYLANGGDNMAMLKNLEREKSDLLLRDAFIQYFKGFGQEEKLLNATIEGRITN